VNNSGWCNCVAVAGNVAASGMGFMLHIFRTLTFSSLLFILTLDAVGTFARYFLSSFADRMILQFESRDPEMVENECGDAIEMEGLKSGTYATQMDLDPYSSKGNIETVEVRTYEA
jgi:hypothetical protein